MLFKENINIIMSPNIPVKNFANYVTIYFFSRVIGLSENDINKWIELVATGIEVKKFKIRSSCPIELELIINDPTEDTCDSAEELKELVLSKAANAFSALGYTENNCHLIYQEYPGAMMTFKKNCYIYNLKWACNFPVPTNELYKLMDRVNFELYLYYILIHSGTYRKPLYDMLTKEWPRKNFDKYYKLCHHLFSKYEVRVEQLAEFYHIISKLSSLIKIPKRLSLEHYAPELLENNDSDKTRQLKKPEAKTRIWKSMVGIEGRPLRKAVYKHLLALALTKSCKSVLKKISDSAYKAEIDGDCLLIHFLPLYGKESVVHCALPIKSKSEKIPASFRDVISVHNGIYFDDGFPSDIDFQGYHFRNIISEHTDEKFEIFCDAGWNSFGWDNNRKNALGEPVMVIIRSDFTCGNKDFPEQNTKAFGVGGLLLRVLLQHIYPDNKNYNKYYWKHDSE